MISRRFRLGTSLVTTLLAALLLSGQPGPAAQSDDDAYSARAYEVNHRSLADAADLVGDLLSPEGTLTLKPRLNTLVVQDRVSVLDRVGALLRSFDLPPRTVDVTVTLFMGHREESAPPRRRTTAETVSTEVRGVMETVADFTKWTSYEPLGSRAVSGVEGESVIAAISAEYLVAFVVESVHAPTGKVKFERVSLRRIERKEDGSEEVHDLYTAGMVVDSGALQLLVAASGPESERALFLALQARAR
jgi:hypothetical protein